jgi:RNA polymerase sigma-70 factor (ECF subfamily)
MTHLLALPWKMARLQPALVTTSPGEETSLTADGATESIAAGLITSRAVSRSSTAERRRERRWIRAAQEGSEEALELLYRRHWPWAHRAAYLVVHDAAAAEDIAQESFLAAVRALDRFDRRRPFGPWLNRIVVNRAIDWARARALRREGAMEPEATADTGPADGGREAEHRGPYSESVVAALASLSPDHRAVVVLRYLLEYTPGEIAEALELPRGTVNSRLRRALDRLQTQLEAEAS